MTPLLQETAAFAAEARAALRAELRARRRAVGDPARAAAAAAVSRHLERLRWLRPGAFVATYFPIDGELDPRPIIAAAANHRCHVYLPRIAAQRDARMRFFPSTTARAINRYGIEEPMSGVARAASRFNLILVPLVGFDRNGFRLGMGAGYYDRALAFRRVRESWRGPRLVGLAYAFQEVDPVQPLPHDVPLDAVITERGVTFF